MPKDRAAILRFGKHVFRLRLSATPSGHAFRPRLSATPSGHVFQPRLPAMFSDVPFGSRIMQRGRTGCTTDTRRCAGLVQPMALSLAPDGKDKECDDTQLLSYDNLD